eukprot:GSChrysophyteH1.ASY1.ANO1.3232.1 assembled CDS
MDQHALCHFSASGLAAVVNFPLWRAAAIAQSGFQLKGKTVVARYIEAVSPATMPYRGVLATMIGMTWARGAIFYGSDLGKHWLRGIGVGPALAQTLPPLVISTFVQVANMPLVRSTVTIQDPSSNFTTVRSSLVHIYSTRGLGGLFHGLSAGVLKTVPKYITAVVVKDFMEDNLPEPSYFYNGKEGVLVRSGVKAVSAGLAGAVLTNPLDVLRNEMFKTDLGLAATYRKLMSEQGLGFMFRGMAPNCTAVAIPIAITIFFTDLLERSLTTSPLV